MHGLDFHCDGQAVLQSSRTCKEPSQFICGTKILLTQGEKEYFSLFQYAGMQYFIKLINDLKKWI